MTTYVFLLSSLEADPVFAGCPSLPGCVGLGCLRAGAHGESAFLGQDSQTLRAAVSLGCHTKHQILHVLAWPPCPSHCIGDAQAVPPWDKMAAKLPSAALRLRAGPGAETPPPPQALVFPFHRSGLGCVLKLGRG